MIVKTAVRLETEMKNSGIDWISSIPKDWKIPQVRNFFEINRGRVIAKTEINELYKEGLFPVYSSQTKDNGCMGYIDSYDFEKEGLTWTTDGAYAGTVFYRKGKYNCTNVCGILTLKDGFDVSVPFCKYSIGWSAMNCRRADINGYKIMSNEMAAIKFVMPPLFEQQAIADYLDETCSKIDEIIAEAKASIDEYEKLRQATIDENILGYDSVHIKLRQLGSLKNGLNFSHSDDVANIKFLGVGCFKDNMILSEVADFADEHIDFEISEEYLLSNGDIVFVRSNGSKELVGRSIMVENIDYPVTFSGFCIRFRNMHTELVDNRFLLYYFRTTHFKQSLLKYSNDSTNINNLNQEMLNAIRINAPVIGEQKLLVKKLEEQVLMIDSLISEKESLINDLEAYKKSLIYEVVTGKRRVV